MNKYLPISINSSIVNYKVIFNELDNLKEFVPLGDFLLIDNFFKGKISIKNERNIYWIDSNEEAKTYSKLNEIFISLKESNINRSSQITAIGGGVVQDIATLVSSLYMRGIKWNYIPTTFLGMTDSCLGGKSSINVGKYKNLVGNFHPPYQIEIIPEFIKTLPKVELFAGLAESAKICFCRGENFFDEYLSLSNSFFKKDLQNKELCDLLYHTLKIKKWFIEKDEFDKAERKLLNYGHTWGHALESATNFSIPHGLAVAIGMMASINFLKVNFKENSLWDHCEKIIMPFIEIESLKKFNEELFVTAFESDKKHSNNYYHLILPDNQEIQTLGVEELKLKKNKKNLDEILNAMKSTITIIEKKLLQR